MLLKLAHVHTYLLYTICACSKRWKSAVHRSHVPYSLYTRIHMRHTLLRAHAILTCARTHKEHARGSTIMFLAGILISICLQGFLCFFHVLWVFFFACVCCLVARVACGQENDSTTPPGCVARRVFTYARCGYAVRAHAEYRMSSTAHCAVTGWCVCVLCVLYACCCGGGGGNDGCGGGDGGTYTVAVQDIEHREREQHTSYPITSRATAPAKRAHHTRVCTHILCHHIARRVRPPF